MMIHDPTKRQITDEDKGKRQKDNVTQDVATGFLFTLSNPLIVLLIFPLFASVGFPDSNFMFYHYILGYISIVAGALIWWWVITFVVDKVRAHINMGSMMLINRIMGALILVIAAYGLLTGLQTKFNFSLF